MPLRSDNHSSRGSTLPSVCVEPEMVVSAEHETAEEVPVWTLAIASVGTGIRGHGM